VTLCHVDRFFRHVFQVDDTRLDNLLSLDEMLCLSVVVVGIILARILSDQISLVSFDNFLFGSGLCKFLVGLEKLLEHEE